MRFLSELLLDFTIPASRLWRVVALIRGENIVSFNLANMVKFTLWDDYQRAVHELYAQAPFRTRYVVKYRHCDGKLVLKVSDGPKSLKFKTDKMQDLNKFEKLNRSLMAMMQQNPIDLDKVEAEKLEMQTSGTTATAKGQKSTKKGKGKKK
ncbi:hypothetical protein O5D80_004455 [Batrachochytrium dendrobatidis]|nr:hypothetical protein O5D80_004455 [Batrachochytrium dendrobatidis]